MELYIKNTNFAKYAKNKIFWIFFYVVGNSEWVNAGLPTPTLLIPLQHSYYIGYAIEGYFATNKNKKFLQDVKLRLIATLAREGAQIVRDMGRPIDLKNKEVIHYNPDFVYNLRDDIAPCLISLNDYNNEKERDKLYSFFSALGANTEDLLFDSIRFAVYDFVRANSKDALTYEYVEQIAKIKFELIGSKKGWSTAKAKAKAIYNWVKEKYRPGGVSGYKRKYTDEGAKMANIKQCKINAQKKYEKAKKDIISLITGLYKEEYKKKDGSWNINKIAKDTGYTRPTVYKHLKDANLL